MAKSSRDRLLDAAETRFAEKGFGATSVGEIADDVGIRGPSLYKHFATKHALYEAVMERLLDPYFELLNKLLEPPSDMAIAQRNLETVARHYYDTPNLARLVQHAALAGGSELSHLEKRWFKPFFKRAAELTAHVGRDPQHSAFVVMAFHSIMAGYITLAPLHRRILGEDPMSKKAREKHMEFMRSLAGALFTNLR